jgi:arylsulfatase A-like enzyme
MHTRGSRWARYWTQKDTGDCGTTDVVDLWVAEEDGYEGPAADYVTHCSADYNRTTGDGCVAGLAATQADHGYEDRVFAGRVEQIIQNHPSPNTTPLFLFWAPHLVHTSLMVPAPYLDEFDFMQPSDKQGPVWSHDPPDMKAIPQEGHTRQLYAAMVHYADTVLGEVVDLLAERQMWNNTLLVFVSDNGGAIYGNGSAGGNNWPLRGGKGSNTEGGIRVCSFASGGWLPSAVRGTKHKGLVAAWDWYATFSELAGVDPTDARAAAASLPPIDSVSLASVLMGRQSGALSLSSSSYEANGGSSGARTMLLLGTEPTDGFPLGSTVGGVIMSGVSTPQLACLA